MALAAITVLPTSSSAEPSRSVEEVRKEVEKLEKDAENIVERSNEFGDQAKALERRLAKLSGDVERQQKEVDGLQRTIGAYAAAEYRSGGIDGTVQLLLSEDPDQFLAQMNNTRALEGQQADALRHLVAKRKRLIEQQADYADQLRRLGHAKREISDRRKLAEGKAAKAKALLDELTDEQRARMEAAERSTRGGGRSGPPPPPPSGSSRGAIAVRFAISQIGEPYVFGADGPRSWDCSGLTMRAWQQAGVSLPHSSRKQYARSAKISRSELRAGDLIIYYGDMHHVGMYVGNGVMVHAPRPGKPVQYDPVGSMPITGTVRPG